MHRIIPPILALAVVSLGAFAATSIDWNAGSAEAPEAAQRQNAEDAARSGAVAAVRAHLQRQGTDNLTAIETHPLDEAGGYAVCGKLGGRGGPDVVARVIPASGFLVGPEGRQSEPDLARASRSMVVMEDGPGLWRGGAPGMPWQRYCGTGNRAAPDLTVASGQAGPAGGPTAGALIRASLEGAPAREDQQPEIGSTEVGSTEIGGGGGGSVTVLSPVRVRSGPSGQSDILWVAERGRAFTVHGHAPGGWVQIGDATAPAGWVHSSLLASTM